ncbi:MAG: hypothetical protein IRZ05_10430 [Micromonosporaceae bacterium]|nr:hypothetical protein [Micromonosporaceae bacterium]
MRRTGTAAWRVRRTGTATRRRWLRPAHCLWRGRLRPAHSLRRGRLRRMVSRRERLRQRGQRKPHGVFDRVPHRTGDRQGGGLVGVPVRRTPTLRGRAPCAPLLAEV